MAPGQDEKAIERCIPRRSKLVVFVLGLVVCIAYHSNQSLVSDATLAVKPKPTQRQRPLIRQSSTNGLNHRQHLPDGYDVLDVGSSKGGGSINFLTNSVSKLNFVDADTALRLDARTLGLDYNQDKVNACNTAQKDSRNDCLLFDILKDSPNHFSFARTISGNLYWHVLEHIPNCGMAKNMWVKAAAMSERFSSFHGPAYDGELSASGEQPTKPHRFWENWHGHTCHFNSTMLERAIRAVPKTTAFVVVNHGTINSTDHAIIVPADTPADSHHYDPEKMSAKDIGPIDPPLFEEMRACAVYDEDPFRHMSLYAALCIQDALRPTGRFSKSGHRIVACSMPETDDASRCVKNLKATAVATIQPFEHLHTDDILLTIQR